MNLKGLLKDKLNEEELKNAPRSYETVGDIAILEIPESLVEKSSMIAETLISDKKNIRTVVGKNSDREGEFRTKKYKILSGSSNLETIHKENGYRLKLNINEVYFSSKESTERDRISKLIRDGERVLVMGCGIGPFPIAIAKKKRTTVDGIDINPSAIEYFKENIRLNKLKGTVNAYLGDAKTPPSDNYDRILITIPHQPLDFVKSAIKNLRKGGRLHVYLIEKRDGEIIEDLKKELSGINYEITDVKKVLPYSPRIDKICVEIVIN